MPSDAMTESRHPKEALSGITVLEFGAYAAGPAIGKYFANFGAQVIHIESASHPDGFRLQYPPFRDNKVDVNSSGCFAFFNDSKFGVTLNLKHPKARSLVFRMVAKSDVVIENMRPGIMERLGLSYENLKPHNPKLVMLSTSNLGQTGSRAAHPGFGSQLSSLSGFTEFIGSSDGPPQCMYGPYIDMVAVALGGSVILAALERRHETGQGAFIDLAQYEAGLQFVSPALLEYSTSKVSMTRQGNRDRVAVPHGCYRCSDGWVVLSCWDDAEWIRLADVIGHLDLKNESELKIADGRRAREMELNNLISRWTADKKVSELVEQLQSSRVHSAPVNTMKDLFADSQLQVRNAWQPYSTEGFGTMKYRMVSYQLSETPGKVKSAAPFLGQHNSKVFENWLGLSETEYLEMQNDGIFS